MAEIKICGLKMDSDIDAINQFEPEYAGMVIYFPKSSRNVTEELAQSLIGKIKTGINKVAVTVSPSLEQASMIKKLGFDYIQIHGDVSQEVIDNTTLPIIRAVNISEKDSPSQFEKELEKIVRWDNIYGVLFDAGTPGSGKTFDWKSIERIQESVRKSGLKLFLAGGLNEHNVSEAVSQVNPDVVDVSSGVEYDDGPAGSGKDADKIKSFIKNARALS